MPAQSRVGRCDLLDRVPNAPCHSGSRPLSRTSELAAASSETERAAQVFDDSIEFLAGLLGAADVMGGVGLVDFLLEIAHACLEFAAGAVVEHRHVATDLGRAVGKL